MFCPHCGKQIPPQSIFCSHCGQPVTRVSQSAAPAAVNGYVTTGSIKALLATPQFLAICILQSIGTFLQLSGGGFPPIAILFSVALWLSYAAGRSSEPYFKTVGLKIAYGTLLADWILTWILIGLVLIGGLLVCFGSSFLSLFMVPDFFGGYGWNSPAANTFLPAALGTVVAALLGGLLIVAAGAMAVVNIFFTYRCYKFSRSLFTAAVTGGGILFKPASVRVWLMVVGILSCLSVFGLFGGLFASMAAIGSCCTGAAAIVASVTIKKYLS